MLGRIFAVTLSLGAAMTANAARAGDDAVAGAIAGVIVGAAIATAICLMSSELLREYIVCARTSPLPLARTKSGRPRVAAAGLRTHPEKPERHACRPDTTIPSSTTAR